MAGRAPFSKEEAGVIPRCYLLNSQDSWEPAKNPLNRWHFDANSMKLLGQRYAEEILDLQNKEKAGQTIAPDKK